MPSAGFEIVERFRDADTVVVDHLAVRTVADATLCASLWGKALCDNEWVRSGGTHGTCLQHVKCGGKDQPSLQIYMSAAFQRDHPVVSANLFKAAAKHNAVGIRGPGGQKVKTPIFRVLGGAAPDKGPVAVRSLFVVSEAELKTEMAKKRLRIVPVGVEGQALELGAGSTRL